jgi:hypothetical protein
MPNHLDSLRLKRGSLLEELQAIDRLRRGSLSKQFFKAAPGQSERRGPYFVLQGFLRGKKFSERIPAEQAPEVQEQVDNYRRFQALAEEYVTLSDEITRLESAGSGGKKNSSRRRSPPNGSRKRPPS